MRKSYQTNSNKVVQTEAPIAQNFRLSVNRRFSSLKKRQSVPNIVPWPQEDEIYNKMKKRKFELGALVLGPSFEIALGLSSHPA